MELITCIPVDCVWNEWQAWGPCSETCGIGKQQRSRNRVREAAYGGSNCTGESTATQECHVDPCPSKAEILAPKLCEYLNLFKSDS